MKIILNVIGLVCLLVCLASAQDIMPPTSGAFFYTDYYMIRQGIHEVGMYHTKSYEAMWLMLCT